MKKRMNGICCWFLALFLLVTLARTSFSQTPQPLPSLRFGVVGGYGLNQHTADFPSLEGFPVFIPATASQSIYAPPNFTRGAGSGFNAGALLEVPLVRALWLGLRGSYVQHNATLTTQSVNRVLAPDLQSSVDAVFEHRYQTRLASVGLEPTMGWNPAGGLMLSAGFRAAWVLQKTLNYQETQVSPDFGGFTTTFDRVRNVQSGTIPGVQNLNLSAIVRLGYDIPLTANGSLILSPEISTALGVTGVARDVAWKMNQFSAGIAVKFSPIPRREEPPEPSHVPPPLKKDTVIKDIAKKEAVLKLTITATGVQSDGGETPELLLRVQTMLARSLRPLLPYVFFDKEASSTVPSRYAALTRAETRTFNADKLADNETLEPARHPYYHVLNIVGQRLRLYPKAKLTLTGCIDGISLEQRLESQMGSASDESIARQRAMALKNYLTDVWGIEPARLLVEARGLPAKPSLPIEEPDKIRENRRAEISADTPQILEPLLLHDTVRTTLPSVLRLRPTVEVENGTGTNSMNIVKEWRVSVRQSGETLKEFRGQGAVPPVLDWNMDEHDIAAIKPDGALEYELSVEDAAGKRMVTPPQAILLRQVRINMLANTTTSERTSQKLIDRYSLILFDFAKSELSPANQHIVDYVKKRVAERSTVKIFGFTDRTGNEDSNRKLSLARALTTAQSLGLTTAEINGYGSSVLLYDNDLPEGRFYCRTVRVIVETPLGK